MTARARKKEDEAEASAAEPLDPEFVRMIRESLDDPRPSIPAEEVFAELKARHEARLKRGA
ncbi:MAG TPA: stability determinant [Allosphingosinicella sp.]|jgi:hypothetical protein